MSSTHAYFFSQESLRAAVKDHVEVLFSCIDVKKNTITIHLNKETAPDYPRMSFILFTLARVAATTSLLTEQQKALILSMYVEIYTQSQEVLEDDQMLYVLLYGMRMYAMLGLSYSHLVKRFSACQYKSLYTYPVSMYVFISAYKECKELRNDFPFSVDIFGQCQKVFDFILYSNTCDSFLPFHFSELSACRGLVGDDLIAKAAEQITKQFNEGYLSRPVSSSGVAKCMEDFARRGEKKLLDDCLLFLKKRELSRFTHYMRPTHAPYAHNLFTEEESSQYVCIDTNAHLIHAYLNIYEKHY